MALAAEPRQALIWQSQLALLDAIRFRPDRTASTDDAAAEPWLAYGDGGRWRGTVPRELARLGLIHRVGIIRSARPSRHAGYLSLWQGTDDTAIDAYRDQLRAWLAVTTLPDSEPGQRDLWD
jgi:hypothetical protein